MSERSGEKEVVPRAANKQMKDLDMMDKGNLIDIPRENQSRPENKSGSANNIIPGASLSRAFNTPPPPLQSGKSISLAIGGIGDGKYNERFHSKAHFGADCIIPGSSTPPSFEASLQKTDAIVSDQASPKGKVKISGTKGNVVVSGVHIQKEATSIPFVQKILSSQTLEPRERQQNFSKPCIEPTRAPFSCDICNKGFSSRQGLLVHFGKQDKHFPCKHKKDKQICLRVFESEEKLGQHKKSHS